MTTTRITETELFEALAAAIPGDAPEGARTTSELAQDYGWGVDRVRRALRHYEKAGRLVTHRVLKPRLGGGNCIVAAFTIRPSS